MLDVEFLSRPALDYRIVVYRYRSGILKPEMKKAVLRLAEHRGLHGTTADGHRLAAALSLPSLFGPIMLERDLGTMKAGREGSRELEQALEALATGTTHAFLMLPKTGPIAKQERWSEVLRSALLVEEPDLSEETLSPVLEYLMASSDLYDFSKLVNRTEFVRSFDDFAESDGLPELIHEFHTRVLQQIDVSTNVYSPDPKLRGAGPRSGDAAVSRRLNTFVRDAGHLALIELVAALARRQLARPATSNALVARLYRDTDRLLRRGVVPAERAMLWTSLLFAWERRLTQNPFSLAFDRMARDYAARAHAKDSRVLDGIWPELGERLRQVAQKTDDALAPSRSCAAAGLVACLSRSGELARLDWVARLNRAVKSLGLREALAQEAVD